MISMHWAALLPTDQRLLVFDKIVTQITKKFE